MTIELFNEFGYYTGPQIPKDCIYDLTRPGVDANPSAEDWVRRLDFEVPRLRALRYLISTGGWAPGDLTEKRNTELAEIILRQACNDIAENGAWLGLTS